MHRSHSNLSLFARTVFGLTPLCLMACVPDKSIDSNLLGTQQTSNTQGSDVEVSPIYRAYSLTYDEAQKRLAFSSGFRVQDSSGASVTLKEPSMISFEGETLEPFTISESAAIWIGKLISPLLWLSAGTRYSLIEDTGHLASGYEVIWVDPQGRSFEDTISLNPFSAEFLDNAIEFNKPVSIVISRSDEIHEESVEFHAQLRQNQRTVAQTRISNRALSSSGQGQFVFSRPTRQTCQPGPATIVLAKSSRQSLTQGESFGGHITLNYQLIPIPVEIGNREVSFR